MVNMFKHDNNHNVSIIPEDEAPYRPLQVYEAAFIVHCNIITSGTDINMINRFDQVRRNFKLYHMRFSLDELAKLKPTNNKLHAYIINFQLLSFLTIDASVKLYIYG